MMVFTAVEIRGLFDAWAQKVEENMTRLIELDSVAGDGDLGIAMKDGFTAASAKLRESDETDLGKLLYLAGKTFSTAAPSTTGTLLASGMMSCGKTLRGQTEISVAGLAQMADALLAGVMKIGGGKRGEKTLIDALAPAADALLAARDSQDMKAAAKLAAKAANDGADATVGMKAIHGRAAVRGEDSRGMIDPGAVLISLLFEEMADYFHRLP